MLNSFLIPPQATETECRVRIAVNAPVYGQFDYLVKQSVLPGSRVKVNFGFQRGLVGVVTETVAKDEPLPPGVKQLRAVNSVTDDKGLLPDDVLAMADFAARYYHHPPGEVLATALPSRLRKGEPAKLIKIFGWTITEKGLEVYREGPKGNAKRRHELLGMLSGGQTLTRDDFIGQDLGWREALKRMKRQGLVDMQELTSTRNRGRIIEPDFEPTPDQGRAIDELIGMLGGYGAALLDGVTGSGKTEVYLQAAQAAVDAGKQVLVLVPEIGLTPQVVRRFQSRLDAEVLVLHSGLTDKERADAWLRARAGLGGVVVGTRSAVWTPMPNLGLIIVDEEHDRSFKQQEGGFAYNARDLAIWRAHHRRCPVVLGSATPSMETMRHALAGHYRHLTLPERVGTAGDPTISVLDMSGFKQAFHPVTLNAIGETLDRREQVLVFLNRRGYAPVLLCGECGETRQCPQCDHELVVHERQGKLRCHWCGHFEVIPQRCDCGSPKLFPVGHGTERLGEKLSAKFQDWPVVRIDRDTVRHRGALEEKLAIAHSGDACILVGTQMLTKGHDLPNLTLVVVVDVDGGLFATELKSQEWLAQTLVQVAGRAGRAEKDGKVLVQSKVPDHGLLKSVLSEGYHAALSRMDAERKEAQMPPYTHMAILRFASGDAVVCERFGRGVKSLAAPLLPEGVSISGPIAGSRPKVAGRWQFYFVIESTNRQQLHGFLSGLVERLSGRRKERGLRWGLDVDPYELS